MGNISSYFQKKVLLDYGNQAIGQNKFLLDFVFTLTVATV